MAPGPAAANTVYKCPKGVSNHHYCTKHVFCKVPALRGKTVGRATFLLREHGCRLGTVVSIKGTGVKKGHVLRSKPKQGRVFKKGKRVKLYIRK
jgi:beta-lactam-binding protein with PASTA domain